MEPMYIYPSGLKCNASPARIKVFESVVPPIACVAVFLGVIPAKFVGDLALMVPEHRLGPPLALLATGVLWIVWMGFCVMLFTAVFEVWCRPVNDDPTSRGRPTKRSLFVVGPKDKGRRIRQR
jgi:hypothetical protein